VKPDTPARTIVRGAPACGGPRSRTSRNCGSRLRVRPSGCPCPDTPSRCADRRQCRSSQQSYPGLRPPPKRQREDAECHGRTEGDGDDQGTDRMTKLQGTHDRFASSGRPHHIRPSRVRKKARFEKTDMKQALCWKSDHHKSMGYGHAAPSELQRSHHQSTFSFFRNLLEKDRSSGLPCQTRASTLNCWVRVCERRRRSPRWVPEGRNSS
jgi:hypothetical protein